MPTVASGFREGLTAGKGDVRLGIKFDEFSAMLRELKAKLGDSMTMRKLVDHEVGRVLERAIELTGKADEKKIQKRVKNRAVFMIGGKRWSTRDWKTGQSWHVPDAIWSEIEAKRGRSLTRKLAKIGLSKKSWFMVAVKAGIPLDKVPDYVANAHTTIVDTSGNASVMRSGDGGNYTIGIENKMPILQWSPVNGTQALFSAIVGRVKFYENNIARGVFSEMAKIAEKYPGLKTEKFTPSTETGDL